LFTRQEHGFIPRTSSQLNQTSTQTIEELKKLNSTARPLGARKIARSIDSAAPIQEAVHPSRKRGQHYRQDLRTTPDEHNEEQAGNSEGTAPAQSIREELLE
jgi:hypothetical protein